jgi:hypothetical protein
MQRVYLATSQFIYCGEELFTIDPKIGEVLEMFFQRCTILCNVFIEYKNVYLIVLLDFEDIMKACNFWIEDTILYALWSVSTVHKGLFQLYNATINPNKRQSSLSVQSDHKILFILF